MSYLRVLLGDSQFHYFQRILKCLQNKLKIRILYPKIRNECIGHLKSIGMNWNIYHLPGQIVPFIVPQVFPDQNKKRNDAEVSQAKKHHPQDTFRQLLIRNFQPKILDASVNARVKRV